MSFARSRPSLRSRVAESLSPTVTIPARDSGVRPVDDRSFTERYHGTEFETHYTLPPRPTEPLVSDGRLLVITGATLTTVAAAGLLVLLG